MGRRDHAGARGAGRLHAGPRGAHAPRRVESPRGARGDGSHPGARGRRPCRRSRRGAKSPGRARNGASPPRREPRRFAPPPGVKILIAEDEPVSARLLEATLKNLGHEVTKTANGSDAWDAWLLSQPRVVISDWQMPELEGGDLCRRIRERRGGRHTYLILLTPRGGRESFLTAMATGIDDFLTKPGGRAALGARLTVP